MKGRTVGFIGPRSDRGGLETNETDHAVRNHLNCYGKGDNVDRETVWLLEIQPR